MPSYPLNEWAQGAAIILLPLWVTWSMNTILQKRIDSSFPHCQVGTHYKSQNPYFVNNVLKWEVVNIRPEVIECNMSLTVPPFTVAQTELSPSQWKMMEMEPL